MIPGNGRRIDATRHSKIEAKPSWTCAAATDIPGSRCGLFLGNAGTAFRSLTAALAFSGGRYELDGVPECESGPSAIWSMP